MNKNETLHPEVIAAYKRGMHIDAGRDARRRRLAEERIENGIKSLQTKIEEVLSKSAKNTRK